MCSMRGLVEVILLRFDGAAAGSGGFFTVLTQLLDITFLTLIWVIFLGVHFEVGEGKLPCLKLVRELCYKLEIWHICCLRKYTF